MSLIRYFTGFQYEFQEYPIKGFIFLNNVDHMSTEYDEAMW